MKFATDIYDVQTMNNNDCHFELNVYIIIVFTAIKFD